MTTKKTGTTIAGAAEARAITDSVLNKAANFKRVNEEIKNILALIKTQAEEGGDMICLGYKRDTKEDELLANGILRTLAKAKFIISHGVGNYWFVKW